MFARCAAAATLRVPRVPLRSCAFRAVRPSFNNGARFVCTTQPRYGAFEDAVKWVQTTPEQGASSNEFKLRMYALFKQSTEGPCKSPKPSAFKFVEKAKWTAWTELGDMTQEEAKQAYIAEVSKMQGAARSSKSDAGHEKKSSEPCVQVNVADGVGTITLNRPTKLNAFSLQLYAEFQEALDKLAQQQDVNVVLLTGAGAYYSSGNDLKNFEGARNDPKGFAASSAKMLNKFVATFVTYPKPLVAAVNGPAFGIAATTIALCDIVYASPQAFFCTPFVSLGQSPEGCSSVTFPAIMGPSRANEVLLMGKRLTAHEAAASGLVAEVIEHDHLLETVVLRAKKLASLPPESLRLTKGIIRTTQTEALLAANDRECKLLEERWVSKECAAAVAGFFARPSEQSR